MNDDPQYQYVQGQARPGFPAVLADYEARSRAAAAAGDCALDLRYGPHARRTFDFFPLRLDAASAHAGSPLHRVRAIAARALFAVGAAETPAFVAQSRDFHQAWTAAGNRGALHIEPEADHFSLLQPFALPGSVLFAQVLGLLGEEPA